MTDTRAQEQKAFFAQFDNFQSRLVLPCQIFPAGKLLLSTGSRGVH